MQKLIQDIRGRLAQGAYPNEASISYSIVTPILARLGWDAADPDEIAPEYAIPQRGRVDFALLGLGRRPAVFIEVKALGLALNGDRQLFEYAFHHGVPLCVLTDGREWSFYLPGGQGSYDDRRVYRLQLDDRDGDACESILRRYLSRDRVRDGSAHEDAQRDHRAAAGQREADAALPRAWAELVAAPEELLLDLVAERAEMLCGFRPQPATVAAFLKTLRPSVAAGQVTSLAPSIEAAAPAVVATARPEPYAVAAQKENDRSVRFTILGEQRQCATASEAFVDILGTLAQGDPPKIAQLADAVRGRTRSLIAQNIGDINPARPDLARAQAFAPGWLVGLNISNQEKMTILRTACDIFEISMPADLDVQLPNAR